MTDEELAPFVELWKREMAGMRERAERHLAVEGLMLDENDNIVEMPPALLGLIDMAYAIRERSHRGHRNVHTPSR